MSFVNDVTNLLNIDFLWNNSYLEEPGVMKINIDKCGCNSVIFNFDRNLDKKYKGGIFPFYQNNTNVCKKCDFILFSEYSGKGYVIAIELKKGKSETSGQLNAGLVFADFVVATVNRVFKKSYAVVKRKISIKECIRIRKGKTKVENLEYDRNDHYLYTGSVLKVKRLLK